MQAAQTAAAVPETVQRTQYFDHLKKINDVYYDQIRLADQKAAYIFTFTLAFLVTSAEGRGVFGMKRYLEGSLLSALASGILAIAVVAALTSAINVVLPRKGVRATSLYWGAWGTNRPDFIKARETLDSDYLFEQYLGSVDALAAINASKYRSVGVAFRSLMITVISYVLLLMTN